MGGFIYNTRRASLDDWIARPFWEGEGGSAGVEALPPGVTPNQDMHGHYDWHRRRGGEALLSLQSFPATSGRNITVRTWLSLVYLQNNVVVHSKPSSLSQVLTVDHVFERVTLGGGDARWRPMQGLAATRTPSSHHWVAAWDRTFACTVSSALWLDTSLQASAPSSSPSEGRQGCQGRRHAAPRTLVSTLRGAPRCLGYLRAKLPL